MYHAAQHIRSAAGDNIHFPDKLQGFPALDTCEVGPYQDKIYVILFLYQAKFLCLRATRFENDLGAKSRAPLQQNFRLIPSIGCIKKRNQSPSERF